MQTEGLQPVPEGYRSFAGGMDASALSPGMARPDQVRLHVNNTIDDGRVRPRPGWDCEMPSGPWNEIGRCQGMAAYGESLVIAIDGELVLFDPYQGTLTRTNPEGVRALSAFAPQIFFSERAGAMLAADGVNAPVVLEGPVARKAGVDRDFVSTGTPQELRVGTVMADAGGRLHVASPDRSKFWSSDHEMDPETTPLTFKELEDYYLGARSIIAPPSYGPIMGMAPYWQNELLIVWHQHRARFYAVNTPRDKWGAQDIVVRSIARGLCGSRAWVVRNNMVYWIDQHGRLTSLAESQEGENRLEILRIDGEIAPHIRHETGQAREHMMLADFDGRLLRTAFPEVYTVAANTARQRWGIRWRGLLALNYDIHSTLEGPSRQAWDGLWTGPNIVAMATVMVRGEERLYCVSRDDDQVNRIYRLRPEWGYDRVPAGMMGAPLRRRIRRQIWCREFDGGRRSLSKTVLEASIALAEIRGEVDIEVRRSINSRPDSSLWYRTQETAGDQLSVEVGNWRQPMPQSRQIPLPKKPAEIPCDPATGESSPGFYSIAPVILIEGQAAVTELDLLLQAQPTDSRAKCRKKNKTDLFACEDPLEYSFQTANRE